MKTMKTSLRFVMASVALFLVIPGTVLAESALRKLLRLQNEAQT